jgi:signal peptidase II
VVGALHRGPAQGGAPLSEPLPQRRPIDVRVGSATNALAPVSVAERRLSATAPQWAALGAVVLAALFADQLTKHIVSSELALDDGVHVLGPFWIRHVENPGIAFGLFASATPFVILLTTVAVGWMLTYFARTGARHPVLPVALGLVIGGSVSNLLDRVRLGHVIDFLDPRFGPAFNLADSFIVVGVAILLVALLDRDHVPHRARPADEHAPPS